RQTAISAPWTCGLGGNGLTAHPQAVALRGLTGVANMARREGLLSSVRRWLTSSRMGIGNSPRSQDLHALNQSAAFKIVTAPRQDAGRVDGHLTHGRIVLDPSCSRGAAFARFDVVSARGLGGHQVGW